ncbi:hypothetical protein LJC55_00870 [Eubacteriales bacterium OttesenSCG-928-N14]|nr:hypothetical protein [Eubacteriales bacterium OttesenSCG-928-N14]
MQKRKLNIPLLISAIIATAYCIYLIVYFSGTMSNAQTGTEAAGGVIATALVTPHLICVAIGAVFNIAVLFVQKRGFALVAAILYVVAAVLFLMYALFLLPSIVLSFIGYARMKPATPV